MSPTSSSTCSETLNNNHSRYLQIPQCVAMRVSGKHNSDDGKQAIKAISKKIYSNMFMCEHCQFRAV